ncbi:competence protein CoiA family protein [Methanolobus sp. ZRKC5]|uniref:competence protein CoiA family protein n=1 Tax=unclassified Methanolobus TaxID=2629569 RepID=UPI00313DA71E
MAVQFEFAKTSSGKIVHVSNATKDDTFTCANPNCNGEMILRKGKIRRPHFAHKHVDFDHGGETPLHYNTKILLYDFFQTCLLHETPASVQFECSCSEVHFINLLDDVNSIQMEKHVAENYRPDLSLFNNDELKIIVEIIVTHDLENEAITFLKNAKIPFLKVRTNAKLYSELLKNYISNEHALLKLSDDVKIKGLLTLNYCKNNIPVTYYPDLKNIFPCFGYKSISRICELDEYKYTDEFLYECDYPDDSLYEEDFRAKIGGESIPCDSCIYFSERISSNVILCKNPLAKKNVFCEWDNFITPTVFRLDKYYKSGKRHRSETDYQKSLKQLQKYSKTMEYFEYEIIPQWLDGECGARYMKVYKNGEWVAPSKLEMMMKEEFFYCGKHEGRNLEYVYKHDKDYLYWILLKRPTGAYFGHIIDVLLLMRNEGLI